MGQGVPDKLSDAFELDATLALLGRMFGCEWRDPRSGPGFASIRISDVVIFWTMLHRSEGTPTTVDEVRSSWSHVPRYFSVWCGVRRDRYM